MRRLGEITVALKVEISHYWVSATSGKQWCFFWLSGVPYLAMEDDA